MYQAVLLNSKYHWLTQLMRRVSNLAVKFVQKERPVVILVSRKPKNAMLVQDVHVMGSLVFRAEINT